MATYTIDAVRLVSVPGATRHEHVESVKLSSGQVLPRAMVIAWIKAGVVFVTYHRPSAQVHVDKCPFCWTGGCLTTHPDTTPANNLLHMLTF